MVVWKFGCFVSFLDKNRLTFTVDFDSWRDKLLSHLLLLFRYETGLRHTRYIEDVLPGHHVCLEFGRALGLFATTEGFPLQSILLFLLVMIGEKGFLFGATAPVRVATMTTGKLMYSRFRTWMTWHGCCHCWSGISAENRHFRVSSRGEEMFAYRRLYFGIWEHN